MIGSLVRLLISTSRIILSVLLISSAYAAQPIARIADADSPDPKFDYGSALDFSQSAIGNQIGDFDLTDADGHAVKFSSFHGKPLVLSMVYTSCYKICPMTIRHLSKIVEKARKTLGDTSFSVAIIGFDTKFDKPAAMRYFANKQGISDNRWHLLSATQLDVEQLSKEVGFQYFPSSNGFDHLIQATVIDAAGKVYRQVYGQVFETPLLVDPLIELVLGRASPDQPLLADLSKKIKLFCTTYDPVRDGYYFDYSLFIGMFVGGSIIIFTGIVVVRGYR